MAAPLNMQQHEHIKTMKLYTHLERVENRLRALGYSMDTNERVDPEQLATVDSLHYYGDEPIARIGQLLEQKKQDERKQALRVLDIGAGYGGTARVLAHRHACAVDALELQPDLSTAAASLTKRCALTERVRHVTGNFLSTNEVGTDSYDAVVGLLCFLHIGQWQKLFQRCLEVMTPGGVLYVEDFFLRGDAFTETEKTSLRDDIYCTELLRLDELRDLLVKLGFEVVSLQDMTPKWQPHVIERAQSFHANLSEHAKRDGEAAVKALDHFYLSVASLFQGGNLGGYALVARKPTAADASKP